jgi:23S rRNA (cytosine1962-C5)-methyltransferase
VINTLSTLIDDALKLGASKGDSRRLFHGRGRCWPGWEHVCVDIFSGVLTVTVFAERSDEQEWINQLVTLVQRHELCALVVQRRYLKPAQFERVWGNLPEPWFAKRGEQLFILNAAQQNLGFFLDIEPARCWLESQCKGARVLNLFAFTCSFSVVAAAAGAEKVVNIDMNRRSLDVGKRNHSLNKIDAEKASYLGHDIFKSWGKLKKLGPYDIVIVDPPSFQKGSFSTQKDYAKVLRRLEDLLAPRGKALLVSNSPELAASEFNALITSELAWECELKRVANSVDFPDVDAEKSLKMFVIKALK